jgi:2',3'-cyclic-nucleotide 2'-phosphodiesterase (5'-nucleotidase family)
MMSQPFIFLVTSDIHARVEAFARLATLIDQIRAENPNTPVLYFDAGDAPDKTHWVSEQTNGIGMYRLLGVMGCSASVLGNKRMKVYFKDGVPHYSTAGGFPILVANVFMPNGKPIPGTVPSTLLPCGNFQLGIIGVTADTAVNYIEMLGLIPRPAMPCIQAEITSLRERGADAILLLSHMGISDDRFLAEHLQAEIPLIIGGHTHLLLPYGKQFGKVSVLHIGEYGEHLGCIYGEWDGEQLHIHSMQAIPVPPDTPPHPAVLAEIERIREQK